MRDDLGENRSYRDIEYGELTAQYWAWKNEKSDYIGFMHYRRYFNFSENVYPVDDFGTVIEQDVPIECIRKYGLDEDTIYKCIGDNDIITPSTIDLHTLPVKYKNVFMQYEASPLMAGKNKDLLLVLDIIEKKYPEYYQVAYDLIYGHKLYFFNMFIMKKDIFDRYCEWLFSVLDEFENKVNTSNYSFYASRTPGFLAERLLNVFIQVEMLKNKKLKRKELQVVLLKNTEISTPLEPVFSENFVTIFTATGNDFAPFCGVWLKSVLDSASPRHNYDIVILQESLSKNNIRLFNEMVLPFPNVSIRFVDVSAELSGFSNDNWNHTTRLTFARFLIPSLCTYVPKVVWIDSDTIVKRDLYDLYEIDVKDCYLAAARDIRALGQLDIPEDPQMYNFLNFLKLSNPFDYFQAGVMLLNIDRIGKDFSKERLMFEAKRTDLRWLDQDVLNLLCQGNVVYLPQNWNYVVRAHIPIEDHAPAYLKKEWDLARNDPWVIHYAGKRQPVYVADTEFFEQFWQVARKTPWYESLLIKTKSNNTESTDRYKSSARIWADRWLPMGSLRRKLAKTLLPKDSKRWNLLKNIYYKLKGK